MDIEGLVEAFESEDPDLPDAESTFVERVEAAKRELEADEIGREEYYERVRRASDRYRRDEGSD